MALILISGMSINAQNCLRILPGTEFSGPGPDGKYKLTINYETDGNKTLETVIKCGSTQIFTDCFQTSGTGTKIYEGLSCSSLGSLSAVFTRRTGSCNSAQCGPDVLLGNNVLALKYGSVTARNLGDNTIITFQLTSTDDTNELTFNLVYEKNIKRSYKVILMEKLSMNDTWQITINNVSKQYKITKL